MIAHDPLHRSQRAELPHWAPALGDDAHATQGITLQRMTLSFTTPRRFIPAHRRNVMHETLREFAEFVGRCLAKCWIREQQTKNTNRIRPNAVDQLAATDQIQTNKSDQVSADANVPSDRQDHT